MKIYRVYDTNNAVETKEVSRIENGCFFWTPPGSTKETWNLMSTDNWHTSRESAINDRIKSLEADISSHKKLIEVAERKIEFLRNLL